MLEIPAGRVPALPEGGFMKRFALLLVLAAVAGGAFLSCAGDKGEFRLGGVGPVTGEAATFGVSTKQGIEMAVAEWNAQGGVLGKQIKLAFADDKGDPAEGATVYTKLIQQDRVSAVVGTVMSKVSLAGAPICQGNKIPMISTASTNPKVTAVGDYIFRACFIDPFQGTVGAMFSYDDLKARKAAVIFDIGNDYTKGLSEYFRTKFVELGGQVVAFEGHATGTTDFKAQLTKMIQAGPDVIYCSDYYNDVALIAKQARELGFKGPMVGGDGWDSPELVKIGGAAVEGTFFTNHYSKDDTRPIVRGFVARFKAKYNADPDALAALAYDATCIMLNAVKTAGSADGAAIRDALARTDLEVVSGQVKFDADRNPIKSIVIIEVKGGQQVYRTTVNP
jgi:branched-chain amino acid transport system substrate-binding protein